VTDVEWHEQHKSRDWRERAACRGGVDPDLFFPAAESGAARGAQVRAAKAVCARCPVRSECLDEALVRIPYGIAGGLTERERQRLRRTQHASSSAQVKPAAGEVWANGPAAEWTRAQRAGTGRTLLAAGRPARHVARACGVSTRTVQRWATSDSTTRHPTSATSTSTTGASTTGASTTGASGSTDVEEGSRGGHRAPLGSPTSSTPRQAHEQRKDTETR
jgi:hypothetical protein